MSSKYELINEFYNTIDREQIKLETKFHGVEYLQELGNHLVIQYGELKNNIYKYRLSKVSSEKFSELLREHIDKRINLCAYFNGNKNSVFVFNIDDMGNRGNTVKIVSLLMLENLKQVGILPLIIKSGHGYHLWCRISEPVENKNLQELMKELVELLIHKCKEREIDTSDIYCTYYPRTKVTDISIRLFGSEHMGTGMFSFIVTQINFEDVTLDEQESWNYFKWYMDNCTVTKESIYKAQCDLKKLICSAK